MSNKAIKRIQKELNEIKTEPPSNCTAGPKNIDNLYDVQDRDDWDILSFTHKIIILTKKKINKKSPFIKNRNVVNFLYEINNYRNSLAHPFKIPKPRNITDRIIRNYIDYCRDYFENSRNA